MRENKPIQENEGDFHGDRCRSLKTLEVHCSGRGEAADYHRRAGVRKSKLIRDLTYQAGWKICEARELFDDEFLEIPRADRPEKAIDLIANAIRRLNARVVMIDNVGFLFAPILNLNPVAMLKQLSRECPIIVSWRGKLDGNTLYFEHNGDPKYAKFIVENPNHVISLD